MQDDHELSAQQHFETAVRAQQQGRADEAEAHFRAVLRQHPDHLAAMHRLAVLLAQAGKLPEAAEIYGRLVECAPDDAIAFSNLGFILHRLDRNEEALAPLQTAVSLKPDSAEALTNLGNVLAKLGRSEEALARYGRALTLNPRLPDPYNNAGKVLLSMGRSAEAVGAFENALTLRPQFPEARDNLAKALEARGRYNEGSAAVRQQYEAACALGRQGRIAEAEPELRSLLAAAPDHLAALLDLGRICLNTGRADEAVSWLSKAAAMNEASAEIQNELGIALAQTGQGNLNAAIRQFEKAVALAPNFVQALNNLGNIFVIVGRNDEAIACFERLFNIQPDFSPALYNYGRALTALGREQEAVERFQRAVALNPNYVAVHNNLGYVLRDLGRTSEALASFDRALAIDANYGFAYAGRASVLESLGRLPEARQALEHAVRLVPGKATFHSALAEIKKFQPGDPQIAAMEALLGRLTGAERTELLFALAKAYDDLGQFDCAFTFLKQGNAARRATVTYDEPDELGALRRWETDYSAEAMMAKRGGGCPSDVPVLIIGMPRSGTSLVEQILASHPQVFGAGERADFQESIAADVPGWNPCLVPDLSPDGLSRIGGRYIEKLVALAPEARRIVDKLPGNFVWAGAVHLALPHARLIHIRRDPLDTCMSCYSKAFAGRLNYTYDLGELGRYYKAYEALMAHWRAVLPAEVLLDVEYEDLIDDLEGQAKRIVAFVGLDWDARCLEFHRTERRVHTASVFQVRQPLYRSSIGRWRHYEAHLSPLRAALAAG